MNHLKWMGHASTIMEIQRTLRDDAGSCEVTLVARDGTSVRAHRFVLSTCSDLLRTLLVDVPQGNEATIIIPDINGMLLEGMLSFIYMGETSLPSTNLTDFLEAINLLGIKSAISFECSPMSMNSASAGITHLGVDETGALVKTIHGMHMAQDTGLMEDDGGEGVVEKIVTANEIGVQQATKEREFEFLDVYNDQQKITYSIEHMAGTTVGGEFILTDNANAFTITQQETKIEPSTTHQQHQTHHQHPSTTSTEGGGHVDDIDVATNIVENDADEEDDDVDEGEDDDGNIIEEEYNAADSIVELASSTDVELNEVVGDTSINTSTSSGMLVEMRSKLKLKSAKFKSKFKHEHAKSYADATAAAPHNKLKKDIHLRNPIEMVDSLELAERAVLVEGLSLQKAADRYDVSKTVLWRRVRKDPNYMRTVREKPSLSLAYERLKSGDSLKNISKELDIPMSTLHRHKVRLSQEGRLPEYVSCRSRGSTPKDELQEKLAKAVHACVHEGMSQNHAANLFEIPKSTLWRHLRRRVKEAELAQALETDTMKEEVIVSAKRTILP